MIKIKVGVVLMNAKTCQRISTATLLVDSTKKWFKKKFVSYVFPRILLKIVISSPQKPSCAMDQKEKKISQRKQAKFFSAVQKCYIYLKETELLQKCFHLNRAANGNCNSSLVLTYSS
jgi:hypothetical protein